MPNHRLRSRVKSKRNYGIWIRTIEDSVNKSLNRHLELFYKLVSAGELTKEQQQKQEREKDLNHRINTTETIYLHCRIFFFYLVERALETM